MITEPYQPPDVCAVSADDDDDDDDDDADAGDGNGAGHLMHSTAAIIFVTTVVFLY